MTQFNLLPDVKLDYLKAQRTKRRVVSLAILVASCSVGVLVLLCITVFGLQGQHIRNLNGDIKKETAKVQGIKDLDKILTVQNQLKSLPGLHEEKPAASRVFGYLSQLTPSAITISSASIDFANQTIKLAGDAKSFNAINVYTDTLKFTQYSVDGKTGNQKAFSDVVLSNFSRDDKAATYEVTFKFDPLIFDNTKKIALTVPSQVTTRSEIEKPDALFQQSSGSIKQ